MLHLWWNGEAVMKLFAWKDVKELVNHFFPIMPFYKEQS